MQTCDPHHISQRAENNKNMNYFDKENVGIGRMVRVEGTDKVNHNVKYSATYRAVHFLGRNVSQFTVHMNEL